MISFKKSTYSDCEATFFIAIAIFKPKFISCVKVDYSITKMMLNFVSSKLDFIYVGLDIVHLFGYCISCT